MSRAWLPLLFVYLTNHKTRRYKAKLWIFKARENMVAHQWRGKFCDPRYIFNLVPWSCFTLFVVLVLPGIVEHCESSALLLSLKCHHLTNVSSLYNFICMWKFLVVGCDVKPKIRPCDKHLFLFGWADDEVVAPFHCLPCLGQALRFTADRGLVLELEARRMLLTERCVKLLVSVLFVHNFTFTFEKLIN